MSATHRSPASDTDGADHRAGRGRRVLVGAAIGVALIAAGTAVSLTQGTLESPDQTTGAGTVELPPPSSAETDPASQVGEEAADAAAEPSDSTSDDEPEAIAARSRADSLDTCRTAANEECGPAYDIDMDAISAMLAIGDRLLVADADGGVRSLEVQDGSLHWEARPTDGAAVVAVSGSPQDELVTAWTGTQLYGLDAQDGQVLWDRGLEDAQLDLGPRNIVVVDDAVLIIYGDQVTVLSAEDGSHRFDAPTLPSGTVVLDDGFAVLIDGIAARFGTSDAEPLWQIHTQHRDARFTPDPPRLGRAWPDAPLAIETPEGRTLALSPETGEVLLELGPELRHGVQRVDDLLVTVTWPSEDGAMAQVQGVRADGTMTERVEVTHPCCEHGFAAGDGGFVGVLDPQPGGRSYLIDLSAQARVELVRPDEVVGQRSADGLSGHVAIWRTSGSRIGADQMTGQVRWRSGAEARLVSLDPIVLAGPRSAIRVDTSR